MWAVVEARPGSRRTARERIACSGVRGTKCRQPRCWHPTALKNRRNRQCECERPDPRSRGAIRESKLHLQGGDRIKGRNQFSSVTSASSHERRRHDVPGTKPDRGIRSTVAEDALHGFSGIRGDVASQRRGCPTSARCPVRAGVGRRVNKSPSWGATPRLARSSPALAYYLSIHHPSLRPHRLIPHLRSFSFSAAYPATGLFVSAQENQTITNHLACPKLSLRLDLTSVHDTVGPPGLHLHPRFCRQSKRNTEY